MKRVTIHIPAPLRPYAGGASDVAVTARTVDEALQRLVELHPALRPHLFDPRGRLRAFVNTYLDDEDVRHLAGGATEIHDGATLTVVPSIAGGRDRGR